MIFMQRFWMFFWSCWLDLLWYCVIGWYFWQLLLCCHYYLLHCCPSESRCDFSALLIFRSINLANWPLAYIYNTSETIRFLLFKALLREHCIYRTVQNDSMPHYLFRLNFLSIWSIRGPFPSGHVNIYMICWGCGNSNSNYLRWTLKKYQIEKCSLTETN